MAVSLLSIVVTHENDLVLLPLKHGKTENFWSSITAVVLVNDDNDYYDDHDDFKCLTSHEIQGAICLEASKPAGNRRLTSRTRN